MNFMVKFVCFFVSLLCLIPDNLSAFAQRGFFDRFPNRYFVETGTWEGHGIMGAIIAGCFPEIHSIELSEELCQRAKVFFKDYRFDGKHHDHVHLWQGDSGTVLADVIQNINAPITFWLDAHFSGLNSAKGAENCPVLRELDCIQRHPIKTHTILIDDVRLFGTNEFDYIPLETVIAKIKQINPAYVIEIADGCNNPRDILVAYIPSR